MAPRVTGATVLLTLAGGAVACTPRGVSLEGRSCLGPCTDPAPTVQDAEDTGDPMDTGSRDDTARDAASAAGLTVDAGPDEVGIDPGTTIRLVGSVAPDGPGVETLWTLGVRPDGSLAEVSDRSAPRPWATLDLPGAYLFELRARDAEREVADTVAFLVADGPIPPRAIAGPDITGAIGAPLRFDGSTSDAPSGGALSWYWRILAAPADSHAVLETRPDDPVAVLVPDVSGLWILELVVDDGATTSAPDLVGATVPHTPAALP